MTTREPPWEQNGISVMVNNMRVASSKSRRIMGASYQPALMGNCLTISYTCLPCLSSRQV